MVYDTYRSLRRVRQPLIDPGQRGYVLGEGRGSKVDRDENMTIKEIKGYGRQGKKTQKDVESKLN